MLFQQAVHPVRLVPYGGVDGIGLLVELGGEVWNLSTMPLSSLQGRLAPPISDGDSLAVWKALK
jgi:hypothetical protein